MGKSPRSIAELCGLWESFAEIPVNNNDEIEREFLGFPVGTDRFEVLAWFDEQCPNGLKEDIIDG